MSDTIRKYKIQQLQSDDSMLTLHPETEAIITKYNPWEIEFPSEVVIHESSAPSDWTEFRDKYYYIVAATSGSSPATYHITSKVASGASWSSSNYYIKLLIDVGEENDILETDTALDTLFIKTNQALEYVNSHAGVQSINTKKGDITITNGNGVDVTTASNTNTITVSHADTSSQSSISSASGKFLNSLTLDTFGHVTGATSTSETVLSKGNDVTGSAGLSYVSDVAVNNHQITLTKSTIQSASASQKGVVQLDETWKTTSPSSSNATTPAALKAAYDDINTIIEGMDGSATIASKSGEVVTLKAGVTETDGVISNSSGSDIALGTAAVKNYSTSTSLANTNDLPTSGAVKFYVDNKITQGVEYLGIVENTAELGDLDTTAGPGDWARTLSDFLVTSEFTDNGVAEDAFVGDILVCVKAKGSNTHAHWDVLHTAVDTDTNTQYQAIVGAAGTGYNGAILLQSKEIDGNYSTQDTIKFIQGSNVTITPNVTNKTITITATDTATAVDNILDGSNSGTAITYAPYTSKGAGHLYTGTTTPTSTNRLNYDGYFYATKVYAGTTELTGNTGTVTSVALRNGSTSQGTLTISGSPITSSGTIDITLADGYGDTKNPYASKTAKYVLAAPSTTNGVPTFRQLLATDISYSGDIAAADNVSDALDSLQNQCDGKQPLDADLTAIASISGNSGLLKKTAANTWTLDTNTYITQNQNITINSGKKADGSTDIISAAARTALTLADSGVTAGTYSALQVNAKGIVVRGGNIVEIGTTVNGSPSSNLATGGLYFQLLAD